MTEFIPSARTNNIFYGDIFNINEKVYFIFGFGKSKAGRIASNNNDDNQK